MKNASERPGRHAIRLFNRLWGWEHSIVAVGGVPYLERWILYFGRCGLRLHKFWRGDDDRAPHDHPFWFITFPLQSYIEREYRMTVFVYRINNSNSPLDPFRAAELEWMPFERIVRRWRFHWRHRKFKHIVIGRADGLKKPFWTFVIYGGVTDGRWGFYPSPSEYVPFQDWHAAKPGDGYLKQDGSTV